MNMSTLNNLDGDFWKMILEVLYFRGAQAADRFVLPVAYSKRP